MKHTFLMAAALAVAVGGGVRASDPTLSGDYVEVRTAEVFTGGCIMGSEGEVSGREAIMAWRVSHGSLNGIALDGLSVVAVVAADSNLGTHELGGSQPTKVRTVVMIDDRAKAAQREALLAMARSLAPAMMNDVVELKQVAISFERTDASVKVAAGPAALDVATNIRHSPECGAIQWYQPLARTTKATAGLTRSQRWTGTTLGTQWKQVDRKSSFFGTFAF